MQNEQIQFIGTTPEQLQELLSCSIKEQLNELKQQFQPKEPQEYLTRQEVADLLKINLATLWSWTKKGKLISYGLGNRVYYKRTEVENALIEL